MGVKYKFIDHQNLRWQPPAQVTGNEFSNRTGERFYQLMSIEKNDYLS